MGNGTSRYERFITELFRNRIVDRDLSTANDRLADNLVCRKYITDVDVEDAFRSVDRKIFYPDDYKHLAYNQYSWKNDDFGIEAPRVYAKIMNQFEMQKGMSFLNVPVGTGYLNTVAGFLLGTYGFNHGLDLSEAAISAAELNLRSFMETSDAAAEKEFCLPVFEKGNVLSMEQRKYDRILCVLSCPEDYVMSLKQMLSVGGILIVIQDEGFFKITKVEDNIWEELLLFKMRKPTLTLTNVDDQKIVMPKGPLSLKELSRVAIRNTIQKSIIGDDKVVEKRPLLVEYVRRCDKPSNHLCLKLMSQLDAYPDLTEVQFMSLVWKEMAIIATLDDRAQLYSLRRKNSNKESSRNLKSTEIDEILMEYKENVKAYVKAKEMISGPHNELFQKKIEKCPLPERLICYLLYREYIPPADE